MARNESSRFGLASTRLLLLTGAAFLGLHVAPADAQSNLMAVVITGANSPSGSTPRPVSRLSPGQRVEAPRGSWTEISFSDGSAIVLEDGGDFTLSSIETDPGTGRQIIKGSSTRGYLRVSTSLRSEILIETGGRRIRVVGAIANIRSGPQGSVALDQGRRIVVTSEDGSEEIIRRPGFTLSFNNGGPRRQSREEMVAAIAPFAPVTRGGGGGSNAPSEDIDDADAGTGRILRSIFVSDRNAGVDYSNLVSAPPGAPDTPPPEPPSRRARADFTLGRAGIDQSQAVAGALGGPLVNSLGSYSNATGVRDRAGVTSGYNPVGIAERQNLGAGPLPDGSARIRRMPAGQGGIGAGRGYDTTTRNDLGLALPQAGASPNEVRVLAGYFRNVTRTPLTGGAQTGQATPYDIISNAYLMLTQYVYFSPFDPRPSGFYYQYRIAMTDVVPSVQAPSGYVRLIDRATGEIRREPDGTPTLIRYDNSDQGYGLYAREYKDRYRVDVDPNALTGNAPDSLTFEQYVNTYNAFPSVIFNSGSIGSPAGPTIIYTPGSVMDLAQRPVDVVTAESGGRVQALPGGIGNMVFSGELLTNRLDPFGAPDVSPDSLPRTSNVLLMSANYFSRGPDEGLVYGPLDRLPGGLRTYIIDAFMPSSPIENSSFANGFNPDDRFFVIGGQPIPASVISGEGLLPGLSADLSPGSVLRFAISDGINPLGGFRVGCADGDLSCSIANQFLVGGNDRPVAFSMFNAFRPEETFIPGTPRGDTHLLVVAGEGNRHPAMRFDLQIGADGRSSAGISVGGLLRLPTSREVAGLPDNGGLALSGNTVGSVRPGPGGSLVVWGNFGSLATSANGYGGHVFENTDPTNRGGGLIGHFAVGESDPRPGSAGLIVDPATSGGFLPPVQPGTVQTVGGEVSVPFGFTRLATNVGAVSPSAGRGPLGGALPNGTSAGLEGFAAGLVEAPSGNGSLNLYAGVGASLGDVRIVSHTGDREITASIRVSPRAIGEVSADGAAAAPPPDRVDRMLNFGADATNGVPTTAMMSRSTFAAVIPRQAGMASVNEDLLPAIRRPDGTQSAMPPSNEHLAWGVFMGDLVANAAGTQREFMGLGFWVAGRPVDYGTLQSLTGAATYQGGMVGNVVNSQGLRTVAGDFTHAYDFGRRAGTFSANFDGSSYSAGTGMNGANVFAGDGRGVGAAADRTVSVRGAFFHNPDVGGAVSSANLPRATGGVFGITGPAYGANGIFVGNRR